MSWIHYNDDGASEDKISTNIGDIIRHMSTNQRFNNIGESCSINNNYNFFGYDVHVKLPDNPRSNDKNKRHRDSKKEARSDLYLQCSSIGKKQHQSSKSPIAIMPKKCKFFFPELNNSNHNDDTNNNNNSKIGSKSDSYEDNEDNHNKEMSTSTQMTNGSIGDIQDACKQQPILDEIILRSSISKRHNNHQDYILLKCILLLTSLNSLKFTCNNSLVSGFKLHNSSHSHYDNATIYNLMEDYKYNPFNETISAARKEPAIPALVNGHRIQSSKFSNSYDNKPNATSILSNSSSNNAAGAKLIQNHTVIDQNENYESSATLPFVRFKLKQDNRRETKVLKNNNVKQSASTDPKKSRLDFIPGKKALSFLLTRSKRVDSSKPTKSSQFSGNQQINPFTGNPLVLTMLGGPIPPPPPIVVDFDQTAPSNHLHFQANEFADNIIPGRQHHLFATNPLPTSDSKLNRELSNRKSNNLAASGSNYNPTSNIVKKSQISFDNDNNQMNSHSSPTSSIQRSNHQSSQHIEKPSSLHGHNQHSIRNQNLLVSGTNDMRLANLLQNAAQIWASSTTGSDAPALITTVEHDGPTVTTVDFGDTLAERIPPNRFSARYRNPDNDEQVDYESSYYSGGDESETDESRKYTKRKKIIPIGAHAARETKLDYIPNDMSHLPTFRQTHSRVIEIPSALTDHLDQYQRPFSISQTNHREQDSLLDSLTEDRPEPSLLSNPQDQGNLNERQNQQLRLNPVSSGIDNNYPDSINAIKIQKNNNDVNINRDKKEMHDRETQPSGDRLDQLIKELKRLNKIKSLQDGSGDGVQDKKNGKINGEDDDDETMSNNNEDDDDDHAKESRKKIRNYKKNKGKNKNQNFHEDAIRVPLHALLLAALDRRMSPSESSRALIHELIQESRRKALTNGHRGTTTTNHDTALADSASSVSIGGAAASNVRNEFVPGHNLPSHNIDQFFKDAYYRELAQRERLKNATDLANNIFLPRSNNIYEQLPVIPYNNNYLNNNSNVQQGRWFQQELSSNTVTQSPQLAISSTVPTALVTTITPTTNIINQNNMNGSGKIEHKESIRRRNVHDNVENHSDEEDFDVNKQIANFAGSDHDSVLNNDRSKSRHKDGSSRRSSKQFSPEFDDDSEFQGNGKGARSGESSSDGDSNKATSSDATDNDDTHHAQFFDALRRDTERIADTEKYSNGFFDSDAPTVLDDPIKSASEDQQHKSIPNGRTRSRNSNRPDIDESEDDVERNYELDQDSPGEVSNASRQLNKQRQQVNTDQDDSEQHKSSKNEADDVVASMERYAAERRREEDQGLHGRVEGPARIKSQNIVRREPRPADGTNQFEDDKFEQQQPEANDGEASESTTDNTSVTAEAPIDSFIEIFSKDAEGRRTRIIHNSKNRRRNIGDMRDPETSEGRLTSTFCESHEPKCLGKDSMNLSITNPEYKSSQGDTESQVSKGSNKNDTTDHIGVSLPPNGDLMQQDGTSIQIDTTAMTANNVVKGGQTFRENGLKDDSTHSGHDVSPSGTTEVQTKDVLTLGIDEAIISESQKKNNSLSFADAQESTLRH